MNNQYKVRAEITGEFVTNYIFNTIKEAKAKYKELQNQYIYDELEIFEY